MAEYVLILDEETDAALAFHVERANALRQRPGSAGGPLMTAIDVLQAQIAQGLVSTKARLHGAVEQIEEMLLPLTPTQRVALIQRIPSPAVRQRIIDLLRDR